MHLDHLEAFQTVVELSSFAKAAEALGLSQPAVSYRIQSLENEIGEPLIETPRRHLILTPAGREMLEFTRQWLPQFHALKSNRSRHRVAPLRLVAAGSIGRTHLFPVLSLPEFESTPLVLLFRAIRRGLRSDRGR